MRIAFLYIAEAYQCYHAAAIPIELAARPGVAVVTYYNDPLSPHHLERVRLAYGAPPMEYRRLRRGRLTRILQDIRRLGLMKGRVMRENAAELDGFDAIYAVENTVGDARSYGIRKAALIFSPHGVGDRAVGFLPRIANFDFVLLSGPKLAERMLAQGLIRADGYATPGYVKLETSERLRQARGALFDSARPTLLYNPHKARGLGSWRRCIEPMLAQLSGSDEFNLIVAPHVKLFNRRSRRVRDRWEARSTGNVLIDSGSDQSLDMSYTAAADIYVGDVSSQVYEFLARPRPCVFLNPRRIAWRDDPNFLHWHLGDVIEDMADFLPAVRAAPSRHAFYREKQEALAAASLGDRSPGAAKRAADSILAFMAGRADA